MKQSKWYFLFSKHGCLSLIKYISEQYIVLVFMILSALLIWFLSTETLVNHLATFKLNKFIHGFANKVRLFSIVNLILSEYVITNQIAQTAGVCKVMYVTLPIHSD